MATPVTLNAKYIAYFNSFVQEYTKAGSLYATTITQYTNELNDFGITGEQKAELLLRFRESSLNLAYSQANQATVSIVAEEKQQESANVNNLNVEEQTRTQLEQTTLVRNQASKVVKDEDLVDQQILTEIENTKVFTNNGLEILQKTLTEVNQTALVLNQGLTEVRKEQSYDDNMQMDMAKQQGGLAQFAVNSGSSFAQDTINDLKRIMNNVIERTDTVSGTQVSPIPDP